MGLLDGEFKPIEKKKSDDIGTTKLNLSLIIRKINYLPALPHIITKLIHSLDDENVTNEKLQMLLSQEPSVSSKILKLANSAFYGYSRKITTIKDAIVVLGLKTIKSLVIAASSQKLLKDGLKGYGLEHGQLWSHSLATAVASKKVAAEFYPSQSDEAFVAGLLHDIGKLILDPYLIPLKDNIFKELERSPNRNWDELEKEIFDFNHSTIGAHLSNKWNFPVMFETVCEYHHNPNKCKEDSKLVKCVHIADYIAYEIFSNFGYDSNYYNIDYDIYKEFEMDEDKFANIKKSVNEEIKKFEAI